MAMATLCNRTSVRSALVSRRASRTSFTRGAVTIKAFRDDVKEQFKATSSELADTVTEKASEIASELQAKWEASNDKPTIVAVGFGALLALYFTAGIVSAVDRLPLFSNLFELIGIGFVGFTAYRYFAVPGEKEAMMDSITSVIKKIGIDF